MALSPDMVVRGGCGWRSRIVTTSLQQGQAVYFYFLINNNDSFADGDGGRVSHPDSTSFNVCTMSTRPTDFNESEIGLVTQTLLERYGRLVPVEQAEVELAPGPGAPVPLTCPALYWSALGAEFVVCKLGDNRFRSQFFYSENEQFGTGRDVWDDLGDCVLTLLRLQADHASTRNAPGGRAPQPTPTGDDGYDGPLVV